MKILRRKFTLIELLVVIAIIAILAGMLLPALNNARKTAKSTICTGRMKDICTASALYNGDYNQWAPFRQKDANSQFIMLNSMLSPYLGNYLDKFQCDWTADSNNWLQLNYPFLCPLELNKKLAYYTSYKGNYLAARSQFCVYQKTPRGNMGTSEAVLVADAKPTDNNYTNFWASMYNSGEGLVNQVSGRHNGYANVGYFDGSVEKRKSFTRKMLTFDPDETETTVWYITPE